MRNSENIDHVVLGTVWWLMRIWMFVKKRFWYLTGACFNVKFSTYYFHMKGKALAEFQICISVPLRLIFDHPPKWWQSGRKEGKKTERQHFKENSSYRANICIGSEYEIIVFWLKFLHNLIMFLLSLRLASSVSKTGDMQMHHRGKK